MKNTFCKQTLVIFFAVVSIVAGIQAEQLDKYLLAVSVDYGPRIDGSDSDACWAKAIPSKGFTMLANANPSKFDTEVKCVYDSKNLYLYFRCKEAKTYLKTAAVKKDDSVWFDSCIELFLYPNYRTFAIVEQPKKEQFYHLIFNAKGVQFDEVGTAGGVSWDGDWKIKTRISDDGWTAEVQIPFWPDAAYAPKTPSDMDFWEMQIGRHAYGSNIGEYSTLFPGKGLFRNYDYFGKLIFIGKKQPSCLQRSLDKMGTIEKISAIIAQDFKALQGGLPDSDLKSEYDRLNAAYGSLMAKIENISDQEYMASREKLLAELNALSLNVHELLYKNLQQVAIDRGYPFVVIKHSPVKDDSIVTPDFIPDFRQIGKNIKVKICRNEYEPASLVIWSWQELKNIDVAVSPLEGTADKLPADIVDVRWVKCWYQGSTFAVTHTGYELTPELLLKNPGLVQVDYINKKNLHPFGNPKEYPDDSEQLLPLSELPARFSQQVWLNIKVPDKTPAGKYKGGITISAKDINPVTIGLDIEVLDFALLPSPIKHGFYANSHWASVPKERAMKEIDNLANHGATHVGIREANGNLPAAVELLQKSRLQADPLYIFMYGTTFNMQTGMLRETAYNCTKKVLAELKKLKVKEVYFYLPDEARGERLKKSRPIAKGIHQAGGKTWVAGYADYFPIAGDFVDTIVMAGAPVSKGMVDAIHKVGSKIFCYANPQGGVERPEIYRRNYGLLLWASGYDGGMTFAWCWGFGGKLKDENGKAYHDMWDDFDSTHWRDHCMVYLTKSGVVDTIQWEGWREGVDDCRYLATLLDSIAIAKKAGRMEVARRAEGWLDSIRQNKAEKLNDLDYVREQMIMYIQACLGQPAMNGTQR